MKKSARTVIESLILPLIVGVLNGFFPDNPGFFSLTFLPYLLVPTITAFLSGSWAGLAALGTEVFLLLLPLPLALSYLEGPDFSWASWFEPLKTGGLLMIPLALGMIFLGGRGAAAAKRHNASARDRLRELSRENWQLKKLTGAQAEVSRELEERVYRQKEAITRLYAHIRQMYVLDLEEALNVLLDTVRTFTGATRLSLWRLTDGGDGLYRHAHLGEEDEGGDQILSLEDTLEGWALRNNRFFSVRMILEYDNLKRMERGRNILTFPIRIDRKPWGVLNIEEMPFVKYNLYTEQLLEIIVSLAESALVRAVEHNSLVKTEAVDAVSGLPLLSHLETLIAEEVQRLKGGEGGFSVVLLEILNRERLEEAIPGGDFRTLIPRFHHMINPLTGGQGEMFHYREPGQLAVVLPGFAQEGSSLFCLELLEKVSTTVWRLGSDEIHLEAAVGFASCAEAEEAAGLLERAEHILQIQKEMAQ